jgi:thiamine-phosphate pyrophosphorylase
MKVPLLHVISPPGFDGDVRVTETMAAMRKACGSRLAIHLRAPGLSGRRLFDLTRALADAARRHGGWCVVNERVDVALAGGAQAAQLGHRALPLAAARGIAEPQLTLGLSVHSAPEVRDAAAAGANYALLGTIFASSTHPGVPPVGLAEISRCRDTGLPVVAIGGVNVARAASVIEAGASGAAVVRAVWDAPDPVNAAIRLVEILERESL